MNDDKFSAVWVSHSSISDFLKCPRAYYIKYMWRNPKTGHKIQIMTPSMALGQSVHEVVESLSKIPVAQRFDESLLVKLDRAWKKVSGKLGGFRSESAEAKYKKRAENMLQKLIKNPGPLANLAVKIKDDLPNYWLSKEDNIILCGRIDWLEYLPKTDSVHIIDFKTSKNAVDAGSLQLPIYCLLVQNTQKRKVAKASYWYLEFSDMLEEKTLPDAEHAKEMVLKIAKQIKLARQLNRFKCPDGDGCRTCKPLEKIINNEAEYVGVNGFNQDTYILKESLELDDDSVVL